MYVFDKCKHIHMDKQMFDDNRGNHIKIHISLVQPNIQYTCISNSELTTRPVAYIMFAYPVSMLSYLILADI